MVLPPYVFFVWCICGLGLVLREAAAAASAVVYCGASHQHIYGKVLL